MANGNAERLGRKHDLERRAARCVSCLAVDGVEVELVIGAEVDPVSGLCLHCQPCPTCGVTGGACWDDGARMQCYGPAQPEGFTDGPLVRALEEGWGS